MSYAALADHLVGSRGKSELLLHVAAKARHPDGTVKRVVVHESSDMIDATSAPVSYTATTIHATAAKKIDRALDYQTGAAGNVVVVRGINRGLNYTTRWPRQTQLIRQTTWWDTRDARVDEEIRPPEAGAQVRILPGAPSLTSDYHGDRRGLQRTLSGFVGSIVAQTESTEALVLEYIRPSAVFATAYVAEFMRVTGVWILLCLELADGFGG